MLSDSILELSHFLLLSIIGVKLFPVDLLLFRDRWQLIEHVVTVFFLNRVMTSNCRESVLLAE